MTDAWEEVVETAAANGKVILLRDGKPVAEVRALDQTEPFPDLFSPEFQVKAAELRAMLGLPVGEDIAVDLVRQMRDESVDRLF